ncbi:leukocyte associated immunoglobulin like receptor 1 [Rhinolophus ferrumequinum]|uniref:leukocyte-associated immunoglobulin-like receptor 1 isoform X1 n=1 Tax=Rhinolophus ferrumequinum TaxID=59479 RepID=UPI00140FC013|nr:leukocyte-associated immunoglobulin-like receptor 1 isoform X1 [Rhinolophus ferrumequinum]KAF6288327.1 leukocyte associated immunoglobulin like receptor 1 [Rhinolophus ferrumequinum]
MAPHSTTVLGLVLCLGQMIRMQNGLLPAPSIRAEPGPVVPRGRPVTILCLAPFGADLFRLEQKENVFNFTDQKITSQHGSPGVEARFPIRAVSDVTAGPYRCVYMKGSDWSEHSEALELVLTREDVPILPSGVTTGGSSAPLTHTAPPSSAGLPTQYVYVLTGVSVAFFLCLLLLVFLLLHRQHQRKHGPLSNKGEEQRPQERLSPAADIVERTPDIATVDKLPEKDTPSPAAGDTQEVTYAQLDHRALTLRAARAVSPQATEPTADSNTYAALARH